MTTLVTLDTPLEFALDEELAGQLKDSFRHRTVRDLLMHVPTRYLKLGQPLDVQSFEEGDRVTVVGRISTAQVRNTRNGKRIFALTVDTGSTSVDVAFFRVGGLPRILTSGSRVMFDGTVSIFRRRVSLKHPEFLVLEASDPQNHGKLLGSGNLGRIKKLADELDQEGAPSLFGRPLLPIYPATRAVSSWDLLGAIVTVLRSLVPLPDPLDDVLRAQAGLLDYDEAIRALHLPKNPAAALGAQHRLRFDEAFTLQLYLGRRRREAAHDPAPALGLVAGGLRERLTERLPFELTSGQTAVLDEISEDIAEPSPMSRLLQGEVGSGKTVVALLAMLQAVDSGRQCVLLAPTEVLAGQHFESIRSMLGPLGRGGQLDSEPGATRVTLLTGSMSTAARRQALLDIVTGEAGIICGTHALIQDGVEFFDLGLVVVDEQHRFGVRQRDRLRGKGRDGLVPHVLVMTATPIPRTVAITVFGDLAVSELTELPGGRQGITTNVVPVSEKPTWLPRVWERITEEVAAGNRAYVVCSRIGDDDPAPPELGTAGEPEPDAEGAAPATTAAVALYEELSTGPLSSVRVGLMHGRLPTVEKEEVMSAFALGELDVLVSTTVIEVGVDVPSATVMAIMDAERFGVSQLHQLRGRVGRGSEPGLCLLVTGAGEGGRAMERLRSVAATNDGFELALLDLAQRREGDVLGDAQSGALPQLRLLSVVEDAETIEIAKAHAEDLLDEDPTLGRRALLAEAVDRLAATAAAEYVDRA